VVGVAVRSQMSTSWALPVRRETIDGCSEGSHKSYICTSTHTGIQFNGILVVSRLLYSMHAIWFQVVLNFGASMKVCRLRSECN